MNGFFNKLFSDSKEVSSKRFIAITALVLLIVVVLAAILGHMVSDGTFYGLIALITGNSAMTLGEKKE